MKSLKTSATAAAVAALVTLCTAAQAGVRYKATTTNSADGGGQEFSMEVEAWADGNNGRVDFLESNHPMLNEGSYLVTNDAAKTIYMVNPKDRTYSEWDIAALMQFATALMQSTGGMVKMEFEDPEVEQLVSEEGGEIHGYPTQHSQYRTRYTINIKVIGMKQRSETETLFDVWSTKAIGDEVMGMWLRTDPPETGDSGLDRLIAAEMAKVDGFALKTVAVTTSVSGRKGKRKSTSRTVTEVTEIGEASLSPDCCQVPEGFERVELLPVASEEEGGNPFGKLLRGRDGG